MEYYEESRKRADQGLSGDQLETIVAMATPPGRGGVAIVRLSGPDSLPIGSTVCQLEPRTRYAHHSPFFDENGQSIDEGLALYFRGPHSFTGEDVFEFQCHGGPIIVDLLIRRCLELGARLARPGEFSERAFHNDKLDLAQAEAIADLISSTSEQAARSALRSLQGQFSAQVDALLAELIRCRVYIEAALDFPEEEIDFLADDQVRSMLDGVTSHLRDIQDKAQQGALLREGMHLVIAGQPNAGKSSLLNALAGSEAAIVTDIAGTTRDVLRERINLDGMPLHIVDTAGLRHSADPVEMKGIQRAWQEIEKADLVLLLIDAERGFGPEEEAILEKLPHSLPVLKVFNKIDKLSDPTSVVSDDICISAKHGQGLEELKTALKETMGYQPVTDDVFIARRRHLDALQLTQTCVDKAREQLMTFNAGELVAEELRHAQDALASITGRFSADDLLGEIFSSFCIGK